MTRDDGLEPTEGPLDPPDERLVDPRAVRVSLGPTSAHAGLDAVVIEPPDVPVTPAAKASGHAFPGGATAPPPGFEPLDEGHGQAMIDGEPGLYGLERIGPDHAVLTGGPHDDGTADAPDATAPPPRRRTLILTAAAAASAPRSGVERREVIVDGWRVVVEIESERRASLRDRARRGRDDTARGGPTEVRAIIPGVVVSVSVVPGDVVVAGQQLLVVEAMKMQNELRAPRDGVISRVAVGARQTIEVGDVMVVLE